uniref:Uncharacterized protein n=1 Tax=viral metagenome TaxID=1070528 RepID=A0A6C0IS63_9ZZZZ
MRLINKTQQLINEVKKCRCINDTKLTNKCENVIKTLYNHMNDGYKLIHIEKINQGHSFFYNLQIKQLDLSKKNQIPKPTTFPSNAFPETIKKHIDSKVVSYIKYNIAFLNKIITIYFVTEEHITTQHITKYNYYVDNMLVWIYLLSLYSTEQCRGVQNLNVFIYLTSLEKVLPNRQSIVLDEEHVNTAFTFSCPTNKSEIVIFRKEEWFKVFIHETFHNFGLDFSEMNINECKRMLYALFPVNSEIKVYEAYSEFWARIMNTMFFSYIVCINNKKYDFRSFTTEFNKYMGYEITYSLIQANKVLLFMNLIYEHLYENDNYSSKLREQMYKENTNVFAYYIITGILISHYQEFILWCHVNNTNVFQFKKTIIHQKDFCSFIKKRYKKRAFLKDMNCIHLFLLGIMNKQHKTSSEIYLLNNLRMTLCDVNNIYETNRLL